MTNRYWYDPAKPARLADIAATDAQIETNEETFRSEAIGGGGGGGSEWFGPYPFTFADYNPALGSGWDGILIDVSLAPTALLLGVAFVVDVTFDIGGNCQVYGGALAGDGSPTPDLILNADSYQGQPIVVGFANSAAIGQARGALVGASQVWIDGFSGPPLEGSGRLWLNIVTPQAP